MHQSDRRKKESPMSTSFEPVQADVKALLAEGVAAVKVLVDTLLGDVSGDIPKLQGDTLVAATTYLKSILPENLAGIFGLVLAAGESAVAPTLAALDVEGQVALAKAQTDVDTFLEKYGAPK